MSKITKNIAIRREEWAIACAMVGAVHCADSMYSANKDAGEVEATSDQILRTAAKIANECSLWQMENAIALLNHAMTVQKAGGVTWSDKVGRLIPGVREH